MELSHFETLLIILTTAVITTALLRFIHIPAIVGYIIVGVIVGPNVTGFIEEPEATSFIAEFGIVFLLFMIGLEFSFKKLLTLKHAVLGFGGLQVFFTILITTIIGYMLGMTKSQALVVGSIVAMSSTAIVMKQLFDQHELHTQYGSKSVGILLFQDLAVIPVLILIPALGHLTSLSFIFHLGWAIIKGILAIGSIMFLGKWAVQPIFTSVAKTRSVELFTLSVLLITLGCAWVTQSLGLSLALGGFMAGMMLGETNFKDRIENDIRPFRDVLLAFFFISIGTQFDIHIIPVAWQWMLLLLTALLIFKTLIIATLGRFFGLSKRNALRTGIILAHGGEFGFAILSLALSYQLLPYDYAQVVLGSILLSMTVAPLMIHFHEKIVHTLLGDRYHT